MNKPGMHSHGGKGLWPCASSTVLYMAANAGHCKPIQTNHPSKAFFITKGNPKL